MIDSQINRKNAVRRLWSGHVRRVLHRLDLHEREASNEILESLAVFCESHPHMTGRSLSLLMARSFCATGDRDAAGRVLRHDRAHRSYAESWLEILSAEYPFPELYPLFSARALRPLRLTTAGGETVWVLDLEKIHLSEADWHEMILMQTLRVLTETVSNVWKKTDGDGTLVVKGLSRFSDVVRAQNSRSVSQSTGYIQDVLKHRAAQLDWSRVPSVLSLDL